MIPVFYSTSWWYLADYDDWATVKNATSWSLKANNPPFWIAVQLQWVIPKCHRTRKEYKSGFLPSLTGVPWYPPFLPTPNFWLLFVTLNIWNQFQRFLKPFFHLAPLKTHPPELKSAWSTAQAPTFLS